jgi:uncharacterized membrane protein
MQAFINFCKTNPVRAMAIFNTGIACAVAFGLHLTPEQIAAVALFAGTLLGLSGELVRANVTPMATLPDHVAAAVNASMDADVPKKAVVTAAAPTVASDGSHLNTIVINKETK